MTEENVNTFEELENKDNKNSETPAQTPHKVSNEIDLSDFSDTAIGDKVKYARPELKDTEQVIQKFQVFSVDTSEEAKKSQSGTSESWKNNVTLFYDSENEEGTQNREYISGARCFKQKDGSASDISFWYEGSGTQMAYLWEMVAKHKGIEPKELSPRDFVTFLNSKPKVKIASMKYKNYGQTNGPKHVYKNMPGEFLV